MILRNSFWVSIKENNKRRIWLWLVAALSYVVIFPTVIAMTISRARTSESYLIDSLGDVLGREALYKDMVNKMKMCFGVGNYALVFFASALAIVSAIHGFSYLYNKRKIDFYMGMPVKRSRRFFIIWLNGVLVYVIPSFLGTVFGFLIAAGNGIMTVDVLKEGALGYCMLLCLYFSVYHLAILSVMLTGNIVITCLGMAVFCLYELAVRMLLVGYKSMFFIHFSNLDDEIEPLFSPFYTYAKYAGKHAEGAGNGFVTAACLILFAAVIGFAAYLCYFKRPAEASGRAIAFKLPQPFIKILITIPVSLLAGYLVSDIVGYDPLRGEGSIGFVIFVMVIVLIVVCCLIQVLYEFDIRGIFHRKHHILISALAVSVVFVFFRFDVFGFDSYLPKVEDVSSAAIITPYEYSYYGSNSYFDENLDYISKDDFMIENMYLTDIGAVNKLVSMSYDLVEKYGGLQKLSEQEEIECYTLHVVYRMGGRRNVNRKIYVDVNNPEMMELIDRIEGTDEYISGAYICMAENIDKVLANETDKIMVYYGSDVYFQKMKREEASELLALYKEDIKGCSFSEIRESIPMGCLRVGIERKKSNYSAYRETELKIYPFYTRCVEYLKNHGYYMENFLNPEDVEKIQVLNFNSDIEKQMEEKASDGKVYDAEAVLEMGRYETYSDAPEYVRHAVYEKKEDIEEICKKIYPSVWINKGWSMKAENEYDYRVTVYLKPDKIMNDSAGVVDYVFLSGEVPEFVQKDTAYVR